jgi:hypothetical protein
MYKKIIISLSVLMLSVLACSFGNININTNQVVGSGNVITQTRSVSGFNTVELQGSAEVSITFGSTESLVISADDNILPLIETTVQNGRLVIANKGLTGYTTSHPVQIKITAISLLGISLSGSGAIDVADMAGTDLSVRLPGSGNITVTGTANSINISLLGSGNIYCDGLKTADAVVALYGSGNISVYASQNLDASIRGSGTITYAGNPPKLTTSVTGSGTIKP